MGTEHQGPYACFTCNVAFADAGSAVQHQEEGCRLPEQQVENDFYYPCDKCGLLFPTTEECDAHSVLCGVGDDEDPATYALLEIMERNYQAYIKMSKTRKTRFWGEVGGRLDMPLKTARKKWTQLVYSYNRRNRNGGQKMTGRGALSKAVWAHSEQMSRILNDDPSVNPPVVRTSMPAASPANPPGARPSVPAAPSANPPGASTSVPAASSDVSDQENQDPAGSSNTSAAKSPELCNKSTPEAKQCRDARDARKTSTTPTTRHRRSSAQVFAEYLERKEKRDIEYQRQKAERENKRLKLEEERLGLLRQFLEQRQVRDGGAEQNQM